MRSISSSEIVSAVRSYSFVVFGGVRRNLLGVLKGPAVREIRRDARGPERVTARRRRELGGSRAALDHGQHLPPFERALRQATRPVDTLKERRLRVLERRRREIRLEVRLGAVMRRHLVPLPALLMQAQ